MSPDAVRALIALERAVRRLSIMIAGFGVVLLVAVAVIVGT